MKKNDHIITLDKLNKMPGYECDILHALAVEHNQLWAEMIADGLRDPRAREIGSRIDYLRRDVSYQYGAVFAYDEKGFIGGVKWI